MKKSDFLIERMQIARKWTESLLADVDETQWFEMPGGGTGHVAWQIGHIAASQLVLIHNRCFNKPFADSLPDAIRLPFVRGSTPVGDPSQYPAIRVIREFFSRIQSEAIELVRTLSDSDLEASAGEPHPLFSNKAGAIATVPMHEAFHAGQIAMIRRHLGLQPLR